MLIIDKGSCLFYANTYCFWYFLSAIFWSVVNKIENDCSILSCSSSYIYLWGGGGADSTFLKWSDVMLKTMPIPANNYKIMSTILHISLLFQTISLARHRILIIDILFLALKLSKFILNFDGTFYWKWTKNEPIIYLSRINWISCVYKITTQIQLRDTLMVVDNLYLSWVLLSVIKESSLYNLS